MHKNPQLKKNWSAVQTLATELCAAIIDEDVDKEKKTRSRLLRKLNELIRKFPNNANSLATKADYILDHRIALKYSIQALDIAIAMNDDMNIEQISKDLVDLTECGANLNVSENNRVLEALTRAIPHLRSRKLRKTIGMIVSR